MKTYNEPEVELYDYTADVITTSSGDDTNLPDTPPGE